MKRIKDIAKELCDKSGCHHKCHDTTDCVVEDEALLLINQDKSNNFEVKSNNLPSALTNEENVSVKGKSIEKQIEEMARTLCGEKEQTCDECELCYRCEFWHECSVLHRAGYRKQDWISVEDRLPEDYNKYLLFLDNGRIAIGWYHGSAMQFVEDGIVMIETVTHWMPLPEAPKMKGGEE